MRKVIVPDVSHVAMLGDEELALVREAANFPRIVEAAAKAGEPHRIAFFLGDLAAAFHAYWNLGNDRPDKRFILAQSPELSAARLFLADNLGAGYSKRSAIDGGRCSRANVRTLQRTSHDRQQARR